jgi:hypothetical protein
VKECWLIILPIFNTSPFASSTNRGQAGVVGILGPDRGTLQVEKLACRRAWQSVAPNFRPSPRPLKERLKRAPGIVPIDVEIGGAALLALSR